MVFESRRRTKRQYQAVHSTGRIRPANLLVRRGFFVGYASTAVSAG